MPRSPRPTTMAYSFGPGPVTPAVKILLYVNIGMYLVSLVVPDVLKWFGLQPQLVIEEFRLWQPVTYMFLHAPSPSHILFNMLILWMFGVELERVWRTPFFVKYYFVTGVARVSCPLPRRSCRSRRRARRTSGTSSAPRARYTGCCSPTRSITPSGRS